MVFVNGTITAAKKGLWANINPITSEDFFMKQDIIINQYNENGKRDGRWEVRYSDGRLWSKVEYKNGIAHGFIESYQFLNGLIDLKGELRVGLRKGLWYDSKYVK